MYVQFFRKSPGDQYVESDIYGPFENGVYMNNSALMGKGQDDESEAVAYLVGQNWHIDQPKRDVDRRLDYTGFRVMPKEWF